jgi:hypothetical protein
VNVNEARGTLRTGSQRRNAVSRRGRAFFNQVNRRLDAGLPAPRRANTRTPLAKPNDEPGVLWDAFRESQEPANG